jgi:hypothetical protein
LIIASGNRQPASQSPLKSHTVGAYYDTISVERAAKRRAEFIGWLGICQKEATVLVSTDDQMFVV